MAKKNNNRFKNCYTEARKKKEHFQTIKGESLTNISREEDTDIKIMCAKYGLKSVLAKCEVTEPMYGWDLTQTTDINERLEIRERMKEYYYEQPAIIRKKFGDNFNKFYEMYLNNDHTLMKELGIIKKEEIKNEQIYETGINTNNESIMESNTTTTNITTEGTDNT